MSSDNSNNKESPFGPLYNALKQSILDAPDEEISEDFFSNGENPIELAGRSRDVIFAVLARPTSHPQVLPNQSRTPVQTLVSGIAALLDMPSRLGFATAPVLSDGGNSKVEEDTIVRELSLCGILGLAEQELMNLAPWCSNLVSIAQTHIERDKPPVYSAYINSPAELPPTSGARNCTLVLTLRDGSLRTSTVRLTATQTAAVFDGDDLWGDINSLDVEVSISSEASPL